MAPTNSGNATGLATRDRAALETLKKTLAGSMDRIGAVLPKHLTPEKMVGLASMMAYSNRKLAECDPANILACVVQAGSFGLDLTPSLGECYLIPRWDSDLRRNVCQFQIGFQGVRKLALQSGKILKIETDIVYEADCFEFRRDPELVFRHEPDCFAEFEARGRIRGVYSLAELASGERSVEVMSFAAVEKIRLDALAAITRPGSNPPRTPWDKHWTEMARKTVLKRHCKSLPRSIELAEALQADNAIYDQIAQGVAVRLAGSQTSSRGLAGLTRQIEARTLKAEPTFDSNTAVERPLRSEAGPDDFPDDFPNDEDLNAPRDGTAPRGREPGED